MGGIDLLNGTEIESLVGKDILCFEEAYKIISILEDLKLKNTPSCQAFIKNVIKSIKESGIEKEGSVFDKVHVFEYFSQELCQGENTTHNLKVASWIAYISLLEDKKIIKRKKDFVKNSEYLYVVNNLVFKDICESDISTVLKSNLFHELEDEKYEWISESIQEYLCALFLKEKYSFKKIHTLLFDQVVNNRIVPRLRNVAVWLINMNVDENFVGKIIENDLLLVLTTDFSKYSSNFKKKFMKKMIEYCADVEHENEIRDSKEIYKTCRFDGCEVWIRNKLDSCLQFYSGTTKSERTKLNNQFFDNDSAANDGKYINTLIMKQLLIYGMVNKIKEISSVSLEIASSFFNNNQYDIGNYAFEAYLNLSDPGSNKIDLIFEALHDGCFNKKFNMKYLRGHFVINVLNYSLEKKSVGRIMNLLVQYEQEIFEENNTNELVKLIKKIKLADLESWFFSQQELLSKVALVDFIVDRLRSHYRHGNNEHLLQKLNKFLLNKKFTTKSGKIASYEYGADPKEGDLAEIKEEFESSSYDINELCEQIIQGNLDLWDEVVMYLLKRNQPKALENFDVYFFAKLFKDEELLKRTGWDSCPEKSVIVSAAKHYFLTYKHESIISAHLTCSLEHELLIYVLLKEDYNFIRNVNVKKLEEWAISMISLTPLDEHLVRLLFERIPQQMYRIITRNIDGEESGHGLVFYDLEPARYTWTEEMKSMMTDKIYSSQVHVAKKKPILKFIRNIDYSFFQSLVRSLFETTINVEVELRAYILNIMFVHNECDVSLIITQLIEEKQNDLITEFIVELMESNTYFDFLKLYDGKKVAEFYLMVINHKQDVISSLIRRRKPLESFFSNYKVLDWPLEAQIQDLMESVLYWLKSKGDTLSFKELYNLKNMLPNNKDVQDAWNSIEELYLKSESDHHKFDISDLKSIVHDDEFSIIRNEEQLMEVIFEALDDLQTRLNQKECSIKYLLWNVVKSKEETEMLTPKDENSLSDFIKWHLDTFFYNRRIHFNREVHITTFPERNILDIKCQGYNDKNKNMEVYIEVKGSWNSHLWKSMEIQLLGKYMQISPYGLYIVGWFFCEAWRKYRDSDGNSDSRFKRHIKKKSFEQAKEELIKQAEELSVASGKQVRTYILDFSLN